MAQGHARCGIKTQKEKHTIWCAMGLVEGLESISERSMKFDHPISIFLPFCLIFHLVPGLCFLSFTLYNGFHDTLVSESLSS